MSESRNKELARKRAAVIFSVRSGRITAEEGAKQLGVSRKTYYEWERRALEAMTGALENGAAGRPGIERNEEKEQLEAQIAELEDKLFVAEKTVEVRDMLHAYELQNAGAKESAGEKKRKRRKKQ